MLAALEAARWAPSPHNSQPWRFAVVGFGPRREQLAEAMAQRWFLDLTSHREVTPAIMKRLESRRRRLREAPAAIIACLAPEGLDDYPDAERRQAEWLTAEHSLGAAVQNMLLSLYARGLGSCWICAPAFCPEVVAGALDLPADWVPRALVLAGYPREPLPEKPRRPLGDFVLYR